MISSDWTGQLRRDLHRWDDIVAQRWYYPWRWAEAEHHRDSGLRYGHVRAQYVSCINRIASKYGTDTVIDAYRIHL